MIISSGYGRKRHSIFKTLIFVYLFSVIPLLLLFLIANKATLDFMHTQQTNSLKTYLTGIRKQVETEVARVFSAQQAMISNDTAINQLMYNYQAAGSYELGRIVSEIHGKLSSLNNTSSLITNSSLYVHTIDREFATNRYYNDNVTIDDRLKYFESRRSPSSLVTYHDGRMYVSSHSPNIYSNPSYYILSEIDIRSMMAFFAVVDPEVHTSFVSHGFVATNESESEISDHLAVEMISNPEPGVVEPHTSLFSFGNEQYLLVHARSIPLNGVFAAYVGESVIFGKLKVFNTVIWSLAVLTALAVLALLLGSYRTIKVPLEILRNAFKRAETGSLQLEVAYEANNEFGDLLHSYNVMVGKLNDTIQQVYAKDTSLRMAEMKRLQAQIAPHFLYNSFNILSHSISRNDNQVALPLARALSRYFKYITQNNADYDTLRNEFEFAKTYIDIQKIRFGKRVAVSFRMIDSAHAALYVPKMIIQPLIENCYKYAFANMVENGRLTLDWRIEKDNLVIFVVDNGPGVDSRRLLELQKALGSGNNIGHNGILNVHQRLLLRYQEHSGLNIDSVENQYFRVEIVLPLTETVART